MLHRITRICPACHVPQASRDALNIHPTEASFRLTRPKNYSTPRNRGSKRKSLSRTPGRMMISPQVNEPLAGMNRRHPGILPNLKENGYQESRPALIPRNRTRDSLHDGKGDDMKTLNSQRALSQISYAHRANVKGQISDITSFEDLSLSSEILNALYLEALRGMSSVSPTPIQRLAIPHIRQVESPDFSVPETGKGNDTFKSYLLAAETGSGKTLAYLLPTIDSIKQRENTQNSSKAYENFISTAEEVGYRAKGPYELDSPPIAKHGHGPGSSPVRPRVIVLLPTAELVDQIGSLFKVFSHRVKFRVALLSARYSATVIRNRIFGANGVDVLVCTPHILASITESDPNILSCVTHLIIDEADSLFDRSFAPLTTSIVDRSAPSLEKLILSSATIPRSLDHYLQKRFPDIIRLATPNVHAIPRRVQLNVVDIDRVPYQGNRDLACADAIRSIGRDSPIDQPQVELTERSPSATSKYIIVFVNERETTSRVANYLVSKGINASALDRDTAETRKSSSLSAFMGKEYEHEVDPAGAVPRSEAPGPQLRSQKLLPNVNVLVMTDIGSRGIDTLAVRHVILYDVPHTTIDFIHRLGRTGRMGRRGRGIVLLGKGDRKDIVREVRHGMYKGQALV